MLSLDGHDLTSWPLLERKQRLCELLTRANNPQLRYVAHIDSDGAAFFRAGGRDGLEGIVCKRAGSIYRAGIRSADWVKVKCFHNQIVSSPPAPGEWQPAVLGRQFEVELPPERSHNGAHGRCLRT